MVLLLIHAGATLAMAGLIWFVQIVHYPLFQLASRDRFERYAAEHQRRTGFVVVPIMLVELGTALALLAAPPLGLGRGLLWLGAALLALAWLSTFILQVPLHMRLSQGWSPTAIQALVRTNWLRTAAWTARAGVALALLAKA